ncbi:MAG TPA: PadR family transcriptional regulator [Solirubrobacteraceae bacterium]|jgi:DNA-binding PadR family transcriptional regulator|nr:PadR family transcriptional regulator [Solirubrobacteraceae bacterium]
MYSSSHAFADEGPGEPFPHMLAAALRAMSEGRSGRHHHRGGPRHRGRSGDRFFGPGFPFGGPPFRYGRKARRGDVRAAALVLLDDEPRNGYQLMQEIEERSDGAWRPSPGSVYPALQQLEDEGLVRTVESEGRKVFELTDSGRSYVAEHRDELGEPWEAFSRDVSDETRDLAGLIKDVAYAAAQVLRAGDADQIGQSRKVLADAKRALYLILAGDEDEAEGEATGTV